MVGSSSDSKLEQSEVFYQWVSEDAVSRSDVLEFLKSLAVKQAAECFLSQPVKEAIGKSADGPVALAATQSGEMCVCSLFFRRL